MIREPLNRTGPLLLALFALAGCGRAGAGPDAPSPSPPTGPSATTTPAAPATPPTPATPAASATSVSGPREPLVALPRDVHGPGAHVPAARAVAEHLDRVRATYDAGLERVLQAAATDPRTSSYWPLLGLADFWRGSVAWLEIAEPGLVPPEPGTRPRGWLAVVPPGAAPAGGDPHALQLVTDRGAHLIRIRPEGVTEIWAGLFLVHELTHLADRVMWGESPSPTRHAFLASELRAAELELAAATAVTGGALLPRLDSALAELAPASLLELADLAREMPAARLHDLAPPALAQPAASPAEAVLREEFFRSALLLRYAGHKELDQELILVGFGTLTPRDDD